MVEIDVRGFNCPIPVVNTMKAIDKNPGVIIAVLLETETSRDDVSRLAERRGYSVKVERVSGDYCLTLTPAGK
jgi:tRNA 2-thiouridine synthesizing protein A